MQPGLCPALGRRCNVCYGENQFAAKCPQKAINQVAEDANNVETSSTALKLDADVGLIRVVDNQIAAHHKARLRVQGRDKAFLLDTGATANLISTRDVDVSTVARPH